MRKKATFLWTRRGKISGAQTNTSQTGWMWMSPMGAAGNDHRCNRFQSHSSSPYLWTNFYLYMLLWSNYILHIHIKLHCINTLHLCCQHAPDLYHLFFIISLCSLLSLTMLSFTFSANTEAREKSFCSNQLFRSWMSVTPISCGSICKHPINSQALWTPQIQSASGLKAPTKNGSLSGLIWFCVWFCLSSVCVCVCVTAEGLQFEGISWCNPALINHCVNTN